MGMTEKDLQDQIDAIAELGKTTALPEEFEKKFKGLQAFATRASQRASELEKQIADLEPFNPLLQELKSRGLSGTDAARLISTQIAMSEDWQKDPMLVIKKLTDIASKRPEQNNPVIDHDFNKNVVDIQARALAIKNQNDLNFYRSRILEDDINSIAKSYADKYGIKPDLITISKQLLKMGYDKPDSYPDKEAIELAIEYSYRGDIMKGIEKSTTDRISKQLKSGNGDVQVASSVSGGGSPDSPGRIDVDSRTPNNGLTAMERFRIAEENAIARFNQMRKQRGA